MDDDIVYKKINEVLSELNLSDAAILNQKVGSLSGGQRKRISIAIELFSDPKVLYLDEPTSPLDPETIEEFLGSKVFLELFVKVKPKWRDNELQLREYGY